MSVRSLGVFGLALAACVTGAARADEAYRGLCDASAAIALDETHFVVADDEHNVLTIYKRGGGTAVRSVPMHVHLGTKSDKESDLEGAARVGDRIYWISSHGRNKGGEVQKRRHRFFATQVVAGPGIEPVGKAYEGLLDDMIADPALATYNLAESAARAPEAKDGLNIEGLAAMPDGRLLIGFRNPVPAGKALVVVLENPGEVLAGTKARFSTVGPLDLGGRGIRSLDAAEGGYLIVAGPTADDGDFVLYRWAGPTASPVRLAVDLSPLNPEALFAVPGTGDVQVLSDDGGEKVGGQKCKDAPVEQRSFRGRTITLPKS